MSTGISTGRTICWTKAATAFLFLVAPFLVPSAQSAKSQRDSDIQPENCQACHSPGYFSSGHDDSEPAGCLACHEITGPIEDLDHLPMKPSSDLTCRGCHDEWSSSGHPEAAAGNCTNCHDPHEDRKRATRRLSRDESKTCLKCHEETDDAIYSHTVVKRGNCSVCHDVHGASTQGLLMGGTTTAACAACHLSLSQQEPDEEWPIGADQCDKCHDPHGTSNPFLLIKPQEELCKDCHEPLEPVKVPHAATRLGRCSSCHPQHGAEHSSDLSSLDDIAPVCFACHSDDVSRRNIVHQPLTEGKCTDCHDPHGSDQQHSLHKPLNETCYTCHEDMDRRQSETGHGVVEADGCTLCHDPHGSANETLLRLPTMNLCITCHRGFDDGYHVVKNTAGGSHPMGKPTQNPLIPEEWLECTSCHDPHGSDNPYLWYKARSARDLCIECHERNFGSP